MANRDNFADAGGSNPSGAAAAVTPTDDLDLGDVRSLYVGAAGNLCVRMADGDIIIFFTVPAGSILPIRVQEVLSTNTTAASIVALY